MHSAVLTWGAASDATVGSTYNVYRAAAVCPASGIAGVTFIKEGNTSALTFTDSTVVVGSSYCYYVTQMVGTAESAPSNTAGGTVRPSTVTIQIVVA